jgi:hypothetical protein
MDWFRERNDIKLLNKVRVFFKNIFYEKIELWRLFGANVTLCFWAHEMNQKKTQYKWSEVLNFIYFLFFRDIFLYLKLQNKVKKGIQIEDNPILIEALSDERRVAGLWLTLAENYSTQNMILIIENLEIFDKYKEKHNSYFLINFFISDWIKSRAFIFYFIFRNYFFLYKKKKDYAPINTLQILNILVVQLNRVIKFKWVYEKYKPKGFVTVWDWYALGSAGTAFFRARGVPSFTFIHGAASKEALKEFIPLNADYIFSWGKSNTNDLLELGVKKSMILECGCPRMERHNPVFLKRVEKESSRILILLTAIIDILFINDIVNIVNEYGSDFIIKLRLHPSTNIDFLDDKLKNLKIEFVTTNEETIEESIYDSDYIILDTSSAGIDAVNLNKPVFVIDSSTIKRPQDIMNDILKFEAAVFCSSFIEFKMYFDRFNSDPAFKNQLSKNRSEFMNYFISNFGDVAAKKMVEEINCITKFK